MDGPQKEQEFQQPVDRKEVRDYAEELVNFLFNSFDYSEGSQELQGYLIEYLFLTRGVDRIIPYDLQDQIRTQISQKLTEAAHKRLTKVARPETSITVEHGGKPLDMSQRRDGVLDVINDVMAAADYGYRKDLNEILEKILEAKIAREYKYLVEQRGRPVGENDPPNKDRFRSDLCRYALRGERIPNHVFDDVFNDIFRDLGELLKAKLSEKRGLHEKMSDVLGTSDLAHFRQVVKVYNANHSQEQKVQI